MNNIETASLRAYLLQIAIYNRHRYESHGFQCRLDSCSDHLGLNNWNSDRLVSCCSTYSIIKCCYCEKMRVNTSLEKSASNCYRLKFEMVTDRVCLHFKINSWFTLICEK